MKEMDDALALMKSDYSDRIRAVKDGESKFLVKQHNIIKYLRRFKLFILESDTKRARAEKKCEDEHKQRLLKIKEIETLRAQFLHLQQTRSDLKQKNDHYKQNKSYLESVKDAVPEQYAEIDELIVRYQILKQTNTDLTEANRVVNDKMESISTDLQHLLKSSQNSILVKNSRFASLLQKLEQVTNATSGVEAEVQSEERKTKDMNRYFCEVQMAIQNIYARTMSSLPSAKAVIQMKKRLQAQSLASVQSGDAAAAAANAAAHQDEDAANAYTVSRGASSAMAVSAFNLDDLDDDDDEDGTQPADTNGSTSNPPNAADDAAARAALQAHNRAMATKQQSVKAHLLSRLDAIAERLEDLQDIVEYIHPGALQLLREGGTIYQTPHLNILSSLQHQTGGGGGGGGGGGIQGPFSNLSLGPNSSGAPTNTDRTRSSRRTTSNVGAGVGASGAAASVSVSTAASESRRSNGASKSASASQKKQRGTLSDILGVDDDHEFQSSLSRTNNNVENRVEMEKKLALINAGLAEQMGGLLGEKMNAKHIPAHQLFVPGQQRAGLPPVRGALSPHRTPRSAMASTAPTPRSPHKRG